MMAAEERVPVNEAAHEVAGEGGLAGLGLGGEHDPGARRLQAVDAPSDVRRRAGQPLPEGENFGASPGWPLLGARAEVLQLNTPGADRG
jgi:hypothetical protein